MNKFSFKLQSVLDIREQFEEQAKAEFGLAQAALNREEQILFEIIAKKEAYMNEYTELVSQTLDVKKINNCKNAIDIMKEREKEQRVAVMRAENKVELARKKLNTAILERKTMEKLKENKFEEYKREYEAEEQKQNDQLTSFTYGERIKTKTDGE